MPISVVPLLGQEQFFSVPIAILGHTDEFP
jgi:hypothetical protein